MQGASRFQGETGVSPASVCSAMVSITTGCVEQASPAMGRAIRISFGGWALGLWTMACRGILCLTGAINPAGESVLPRKE